MRIIFFLVSFLYCQSKTDILNYCNQISLKFDIPIEILPAIISVESSFNQNAVSVKGAVGLMQIMECAFLDFKKFNHNSWITNYQVIKDSWKANIYVGAWYLKKVCYKQKQNWKDAITAYFWGPWNIKVTENYYRKVNNAK